MIRTFLCFLLLTTLINNRLIASDIDKSIHKLDSLYRLSDTSYWPNVDREQFFNNLRFNLNHSIHFYQGHGTNFCGQAVVTLYLLRKEPEFYISMMYNLYTQGKLILHNNIVHNVSKVVVAHVGRLTNAGLLDKNVADQMLLLSMSDNYKGYLNFFTKKYTPGGESSLWSSTNYATFNHMLADFTGQKIHAKGSDLIRPSIADLYGYIKSKLDSNVVFIYLNNRVLYPTRYFNINMPIPTHYVLLDSIIFDKDVYVIKYWDYGLITKIAVDEKIFEKLIYGITYIKV